MNIFKRITLFNVYRKALKENRLTLLNDFRIKVDYIYRMYTVFTVEEADYKTYGKELVDANLRIYKNKLDNYLNSIGLTELYGLSEQEKLSERDYRLVLRFAYLNTEAWANTLFFAGLGFGSLFGVSVIVFLLLKFFVYA